MSIANGSVYRVVLSGQVRDKLKDLYRRAKGQGRGTRVLSAVKQIVAFLRMRALWFGEPRFTLHDLNLEVRVGAVEPVVVVYGVHKEQRIVFVRNFLLLSGPDF